MLRELQIDQGWSIRSTINGDYEGWRSSRGLHYHFVLLISWLENVFSTSLAITYFQARDCSEFSRGAVSLTSSRTLAQRVFGQAKEQNPRGRD